MIKKMFIFPIVIAFVAAGCAGMGPKETGGTVIGAGGGALIGSQIGGGSGRLVGVAIGTLAGALIGKEIGASLDANDRRAMERNAQYSLEHTRTNNTTTWENPDSGHYGEFTPVRTYKTAEGTYCREYTQTVMIGGTPHRAYGTACRQPDGSWKIVK